MPPARRSKRVQGEAADPLSSTKRWHKPRTSSLAIFDASRSPAKVSNRGKGHRRRLKPLDPPFPVLPTPPPKLRAHKIVIKINISSP
jgi:hypothetical protein